MTEAVQPTGRIILRSINETNFGSGSAGKSAYEIIKNGAKCELSSGCDKQATQTLDFDVKATLVQIPVCSPEHYAAVLANVAKDLGKDVSDPTFSINGLGRS